MAASLALPNRPGTAAEYGKLVEQIIENDLHCGEVIRLDGAIQLVQR